MAAPEPVYNSTTVPENKAAKVFLVPTNLLSKARFVVKVAEVLLSFVAFILEEVVDNCTSCTPLYLFEFFSCTAFLFTSLLLVLLASPLHKKVGINCWPTVDLVYTLIIGSLFFVASIIFSAVNGGTELEKAAVAFGFLASFAFLVDGGIRPPAGPRTSPPKNRSSTPTAQTNLAVILPTIIKTNGRQRESAAATVDATHTGGQKSPIRVPTSPRTCARTWKPRKQQ
ncbi:CKLF-like MARVEL transmembrane domain-containing protein 6-like [Arapaima gigas]